MDNQTVIYHVTQDPTRKTGVANVQSALAHAGVASRQTLLNMERAGRFPKRVSLGGGRVGWRWSDLYRWADSLQAVEG